MLRTRRAVPVGTRTGSFRYWACTCYHPGKVRLRHWKIPAIVAGVASGDGVNKTGQQNSGNGGHHVAAFLPGQDQRLFIGYARVSTEDQHLDLQRDALAKAGCGKTFEDKKSGAKADRPGLVAALEYARSGDQLVVWRLDRLGRSLSDLIALVRQMDETGVQLRSLTEGIDTSTINGKLTFHLFAALAEFERALVRERTRAGLEAARARGRMGGRKHRLSPDKRRHAVELYRAKDKTVGEICKLMGISKPTLYAYVAEAGPLAAEQTQARAA